MSSDSRFVILGATGFIGNAVAEEAEDAGIETIRVGSGELDLLGAEAPAKVARLIDPRTVLLVSVRTRRHDEPRTAMQHDLLMSVAIAKAVAQTSARKCVYVSSLAVYGDAISNDRITEQTPLAPASPYAAGKAAAELVMRQAAAESGTPLLVLRPGMVYGPGDRSEAYGPTKLIGGSARNGQVTVFGDGADLRPYLFISDAARLMVWLSAGAFDGVYNLADPSSRSFNDIVSISGSVLNRNVEILRTPRRRPRVDLRVDASKLREAVPGFTFTGLEAGLAAMPRGLARGALVDAHG